MTATTSCNKKRFLAFFAGLVRKNLALSVLLFCIGFVCMPLPFSLTALKPDSINPSYPMDPVCGLGNIYTMPSLILMPLLWVAAAAVAGLLQTAYMQNRRAVDVYHSLPFTRKQLLCANYLAAFFSVAVPMALNYALTLILSAVRCSRFPDQAFAPGMALFGLTLWLVSLAGMLSVAFLVSTQTGSVFDTLIFTVVLLVSPVFLALVHMILCNAFLYGYVSGFDLFTLFQFSPLTLGMLDTLDVLFGLGGDAARMLSPWSCLLWAVLSLVIFAAACFLYTRRPSERAEAPSRTGLLALMIRVLAMLILCPLGGYVFASSVGAVPTLRSMLAGTLLCGFLGFLILEAILNRGTTGLFKAFPLGLGLTALVAAYTMAICTGGLGYETRQPAAADIASVTVNYRGQFENVNRFVYSSPDTPTSFLYNTTLQSAEGIEAVLQLQADAVAEHRASRQILANSYAYDDSDAERTNLYITYDLKNGKSIQRSYGVWLTPVILQDYTALADCSEMMQNCSPLQNTTAEDYSNICVTGAKSLITETVYSPEAMDQLLEALRSDTGRLGLAGIMDEHAKVLATLYMEAKQPIDRTSYGTEFWQPYSIQITESYADTLAVLRELGYGDVLDEDFPALSSIWFSNSDDYYSYNYYANESLGHIWVKWQSQAELQSYTHYDETGYNYYFPLQVTADECDLQAFASLGRLRMGSGYKHAMWMICIAEDGTCSQAMCFSEDALRAVGYGYLIDQMGSDDLGQ